VLGSGVADQVPGLFCMIAATGPTNGGGLFPKRTSSATMPPGIDSVRILAVGEGEGPTSTQDHAVMAPDASVATESSSRPVPHP